MSVTRRIIIITIATLSFLLATPALLRRNSASELLNTNSPPVAVNDSYTVHDSVLISMMQNDYDPDGDTISFVGFESSAQHGNLSLYSTGSYTYRPYANSGYVGSDSFTYKIKDSLGQFATATVNINIVNQGPVAVTDSYTVHNSVLISMMQNDYDPEGDTITWVGFGSSAQHGNLWLYTTGSYTYIPYAGAGYVGSDTFTYTIKDKYGLTTTGTVNLNLVNQAPTANFDLYFIHAPLLISPMGNDSDPDQDNITFQGITTLPQHGSLQLYTTGSYTYTPASGYTGLDSFTYTIKDSLGLTSTATVYLFIFSGPPVAPLPPHECICPSDPGGHTSFSPGTGGLSQVAGGATGSTGPSDGDPVNLSTGRESYVPDPDLTVYNPTGPAVVWQRSYIGNQALAEPIGYGSPGLSRGWVHNYDLLIQGVAGSWGALKLVYPNGASETLTPQLSGGQPTGAFTTAAGGPYAVTGVSGTPTGTWQSLTITWKDQTKWRFTLLSGTSYALNQITNRTGQGLIFTWNSNRTLAQVSDSSTSAILLMLAYETNGKLATATDAYGRQIGYSFSAGSATAQSMLQTVSQVVASGTPNPPAHWTYTYTTDKGLQLNTITVPSPTGTGYSIATINYDSLGRVSSLVDANGNQRVYTYNSGTTQVQVKDSANNVALAWTQKFNTNGLDTGTTDATNHSTTVAYTDAANPHKPTSVTDRNGHTTTYTYDSFGNVLTITTPRGLTTTYTLSYTNFVIGRLTSVQEGSKPAATITYYEPSGLVNTITEPEPNNGAGTTTTTYTYDSLGNVLTVVTPGNDAASSITTTLNYTTDAGYSQSARFRQPLTITDSLSHVKHLRYDSQGRTTSLTDALGNETDFSYNLIGQLLATTYPATGQTGSGNSHTTNAYLYVGGPLTSTTFYDENNTQVRQVTHTYGLEGEALTVAGSTEPVTNTYDAIYRLKTLKDGNNNTTTYAYNSIGLLSSVTMPGTEVVQFSSYDNAGNLLQRIDANSVTTNYIYNDSESLLTDIQYPATTSLNVHFTYDSYGRRSGMTDGTASHSYSYGNLDELVSAATTYTGLSAKTISYSYYPDGSRESMTTPAGMFDYSYDAAGRAASMTNPFSETTNWAYQNNDWLQTQTLDNGAVATYSYNAMGQVTRLLNQIGSTTISDFDSIAYDGTGNRTSVDASISGATSLDGVTDYTYDNKNQLTQETSTRNGGFTDNFSYDSAGNPTSYKGTTKSYNSNNQQTGTGFAHDANGNPTSYSSTTLTFDPENRMTSYGTVLTAGYRGDGLRAWKQNASGRTYFLYDGIVPVVEIDSSGTVTATNTFGASGLVSRHESSSVYYSFDSEGNTAQRSDSSGSVLTNFSLSSHGALLSGTLSDPFGYKGKVGYYTDTESGLQLLTYRYYDPTAGRFITRDPISYVGGINIYAYINNNPIGKIDVLGLDDADRQFEESGNEPKPAYDPWYWSHNESADNTWPERAGTPGRIPYIPYVNISFTPPVTPGVGGGIIVTRTGIYPQLTFLNSPGLSLSIPSYPFAEEPTTGWSTGFSACYGGCFSVTGCESGSQTEIGLGTPGGGAPLTYVFGQIYKW
jgi:RHS repeat-associated protein